jgi:hypothetical protein
MTSFALILTMIVNTPTITAIPGFATEAECQSAGVAWQVRMKREVAPGVAALFVCVEQGKR